MNIRMEWIYRTPKGAETVFQSEEMSAEQGMLFAVCRRHAVDWRAKSSLQELELLSVHHLPVRFIGDSQVVIKQMSGDWPALEKDLSSWADRIDEKLKELGIQPTFELVPRKSNAEADRLATQALNGTAITATSEMTGS